MAIEGFLHRGVKIFTRITLTFGLVLVLAGTAIAQEPSVAPVVLSSTDAVLYRDIFAAQRAGQFIKARTLFAKVSDTTLAGYVEANEFLAPKAKHATATELVAWLKTYRDLPVAPPPR